MLSGFKKKEKKKDNDWECKQIYRRSLSWPLAQQEDETLQEIPSWVITREIYAENQDNQLARENYRNKKKSREVVGEKMLFANNWQKM